MPKYRTKKNSIISIIFVSSLLVIFQNCGGESEPLTITKASTESKKSYAPKEAIVRMSDDSSNEIFKNWALSKGLVLEKEWPAEQTTYWNWDESMSVDDVIALVNSQKFKADVMYAEPNYIFEAPNDIVASAVSSQFLSAYVTPGQNSQTDADIFAEQVWPQIPVKNEKVVIAIIDTGVAVDHPMLRNTNAVWENLEELNGSPGVDDDNNGYVDDIYGWNFISNNPDVKDVDGHGTHCAGISIGVGIDLFAETPSESPFEIMSLKFLGIGGGKTTDAIKAINYAVNNGAKVISNSWGGGSYSAALRDAIARASNQGVVVVAAAGNESKNNDVSPTYPSNYDVPNLISVVSTTSSDQLSSFSNYGVNKTDVSAPGSTIFSLYPPDEYNFLSGTSMAAPFVSGAAAMILNESPDMTGFQVKEIIINSSDSISALSSKTSSGSRINLQTALELAQTTAVSNYQPKVDAGRAPASNDGPAAAGCGTIDGSGAGKPPTGGFALLLLPLLIIIRFRFSELHPKMTI